MERITVDKDWRRDRWNRRKHNDSIDPFDKKINRLNKNNKKHNKKKKIDDEDDWDVPQEEEGDVQINVCKNKE